MIFISYSWKYKEKTQKFIELLRENGKEVWVDNERLDLSLPLEEQIESAIKKCEIFIQLCSKKYPKTNWMDFEYKIAKNYINPKKIQKIKLESQCLTKNILHAAISCKYES